jgi:hypothetical protein
MAQEISPAIRQNPVAHDCGATELHYNNGCNFQPATRDYGRVARYYETLNNNNCAFNGRNLSDNTEVSQFQSYKLHGGKRNEVLRK